jgi:hypothetical protein
MKEGMKETAICVISRLKMSGIKCIRQIWFLALDVVGICRVVLDPKHADRHDLPTANYFQYRCPQNTQCVIGTDNQCVLKAKFNFVNVKLEINKYWH